ncbi:hypothetical protein [Streptomyces sp. NPDC020362]|uniref:hypothetical protein n=1 Tax=unclassified Streptomyces TaxID=2593676 RepID=UPI000A4EAA23
MSSAYEALTACAAALALLSVGCSKASAGSQVGECREDVHWLDRQQAARLRSAVEFRTVPDATGRPYKNAAVLVTARLAGAVRPLGQSLVLHVWFWTPTAMGAGDGGVIRHALPAVH